MAESKNCPTCGSANKDYRCENSAYDNPVPFHGSVSKQIPVAYTIVPPSVGDGYWYCGICPDTWHDKERRSGKDRRKIRIGWCSRCGGPWCDEHNCCSLECPKMHIKLHTCLGKTRSHAND